LYRYYPAGRLHCTAVDTCHFLYRALPALRRGRLPAAGSPLCCPSTAQPRNGGRPACGLPTPTDACSGTAACCVLRYLRRATRRCNAIPPALATLYSAPPRLLPLPGSVLPPFAPGPVPACCLYRRTTCSAGPHHRLPRYRTPPATPTVTTAPAATVTFTTHYLVPYHRTLHIAYLPAAAAPPPAALHRTCRTRCLPPAPATAPAHR